MGEKDDLQLKDVSNHNDNSNLVTNDTLPVDRLKKMLTLTPVKSHH